MEQVKRGKISNHLFTARIEYSSHDIPTMDILRDKLYQAISNPHEIIEYGDWWIICTQKIPTTTYFPDHRPVWMTKGEWDQLRETLRVYRLSQALDEKPFWMTDAEWTQVEEAKKRHAEPELVPDYDPYSDLEADQAVIAPLKRA